MARDFDEVMRILMPSLTSEHETMIETWALSRQYGGQTAVQQLDLKIFRGEIFGLLGPNGAGKSTTIKMLITLLPPSSGTAVIAGHDIRREPRSVRRKIGYVPQANSADGTLTVYENLQLSARLYALRGVRGREAIRDALRFMDLETQAHTLVRQLSGGMIRRLEIALALLHQPDVVFLDEPTLGLDPAARHMVWDKLKDLKSHQGTTILLTTHDMDEADHLCDRLAILYRGVIVALGSPQELKNAIGPKANLDDVFLHWSGVMFQEGGKPHAIPSIHTSDNRLA
jgi:ABC-2 type transport system ATP-binding protein